MVPYVVMKRNYELSMIRFLILEWRNGHEVVKPNNYELVNFLSLNYIDIIFIILVMFFSIKHS